VPLPAPTLLAAHGVLSAKDIQPRDPARDELFIATVREEFPNVLNRVFLPPEIPATQPHLTLASTSSQLAVSALQADFDVRFYGEYLSDINRGLEYVERKLATALAGFDAAGVAITSLGLLATLHFSLVDRDLDPVEHVLRTHLRTELDRSDVQDAVARVAVRVRDTYFVNLTLSNYETRTLERPILPGQQVLRVRPWEGRVEDYGLELGLDVNNNLEARSKRDDPVVTRDAIRAVSSLLREVATNTGPEYAESGSISMEQLTASSVTA
jgi:hypothetical protein